MNKPSKLIVKDCSTKNIKLVKTNLSIDYTFLNKFSFLNKD